MSVSAAIRELQRLLRRPITYLASRWSHEWRWAAHRSLFEHRHYRRLTPLIVGLGLLTIVWCSLVLGVGVLIGGTHLIWQKAFAQNIIASLLVLPIGLAIGVVVGTLIQKHSLRFQVRYAGDRLGDCVRLATFKFILFLRMDCAIPIDIEGKVDHRLVRRATNSAQSAFVASSWNLRLPPDFQLRLDETVDALSSCFQQSSDLRVAFPLSFDLTLGLQSLIADIKAGRSHSDPRNTALIFLHHAAEILRDLE